MRFITCIGATTNLLLKESQTLFLYYLNRTEKSQSSDGSSYNRFNISPMVSIGLDYRLTDKMSLRIEPTFRYGLLKIIDSPITAYLFNAGLNVGYYIGF